MWLVPKKNNATDCTNAHCLVECGELCTFAYGEDGLRLGKKKYKFFCSPLGLQYLCRLEYNKNKI